MQIFQIVVKRFIKIPIGVLLVLLTSLFTVQAFSASFYIACPNRLYSNGDGNCTKDLRSLVAIDAYTKPLPKNGFIVLDEFSKQFPSNQYAIFVLNGYDGDTGNYFSIVGVSPRLSKDTQGDMDASISDTKTSIPSMKYFTIDHDKLWRHGVSTPSERYQQLFFEADQKSIKKLMDSGCTSERYLCSWQR